LSKSYRKKIINEATGARLVSQYTREFWECGWQEFDQRNDKGIDGRIILRKKGIDLGVSINVQIKCGLGYISSINDKEIRIKIDDPLKLQEHLTYWRKQIEPAVLIFVNPYRQKKDKNGKYCWIESRIQPQAWWVDLKDKEIQPLGTMSLIRIPKENVFGEHSKGDFIRLTQELLEIERYQELRIEKENRELFYSANLLKDSRDFFLNWKKSNKGSVYCKALDSQVTISRTFWKHILKRQRGKERRIASLRLIGIAKQIIEETEHCYILSNKDGKFETEQKIGLICTVTMQNYNNLDIRVVITKKSKKFSPITKYWLYSIHHKN